MAIDGQDAPLSPGLTGSKATVAIVGLAWTTLLATSTIVLTLARPFLTLAFAIGFVAGMAVAATFAIDGRWSDAVAAALISLLSGAAFAVYASVATRLDPKFFRPIKRRRRTW